METTKSKGVPGRFSVKKNSEKIKEEKEHNEKSKEKRREHYRAHRDKIFVQRKNLIATEKKILCETKNIPVLFAPYISFKDRSHDALPEKIILTFDNRDIFLGFLIDIVDAGFTESMLRDIKDNEIFISNKAQNK